MLLSSLWLRTPRPSIFSSSSSPIRLAGKRPAVRFAQSKTDPRGSESPAEMEKKPDQDSSKTEDTMTSFGEGYTTRSDEEGFGGIYGGNQNQSLKDENPPPSEFDHSQGSQVKETEKSRHQKEHKP